MAGRLVRAVLSVGAAVEAGPSGVPSPGPTVAQVRRAVRATPVPMPLLQVRAVAAAVASTQLKATASPARADWFCRVWRLAAQQGQMPAALAALAGAAVQAVCPETVAAEAAQTTRPMAAAAGVGQAVFPAVVAAEAALCWTAAAAAVRAAPVAVAW